MIKTKLLPRFSAIFVFSTVFLAAAYAPLLSLSLERTRAIFKYFADDSFYYLDVAVRSVNRPFYTFDGQFATNGFHPLWQYFLTWSFQVLNLPNNQTNQLLFVFLVSILLSSFGAALFSLVILKVTNSPALAILGVVPGAFYLLFGGIDRHYWTIWSFDNGMESPLSIFYFSILSWLFINRNLLNKVTPAALLLVSAVLTFIALSRLDDIFLFVPFLLIITLSADNLATSFRRLLFAGIIPTIIFTGYFAYNLITVGSALPVSGLVKSNPPSLLNLSRFTELIVPTLQYASGWEGNWQNWVFRALQLFVPTLLAFAVLSYLFLTNKFSLRQPLTEQNQVIDKAIGIFSFYTVLKGLYNILCVRMFDQGHWYYTIEILIFNLIVVYYLSRLVNKTSLNHLRSNVRIQYLKLLAYILVCAGMVLVAFALGNLTQLLKSPDVLQLILWLFLLLLGGGIIYLSVMSQRRLSKWSHKEFRFGVLLSFVSVLACISVVIINANAFVDFKRTNSYNTQQFMMWQNQGKYGRELQKIVSGGFIELDDGIISYVYPDVPALGGLGFTLDRQALEAKERGELLDLAYQRGFRWLASSKYINTTEALSGDLVGSFSSLLPKEKLDHWNFKVVYTDPSVTLVFIEFSPKSDK